MSEWQEFSLDYLCGNKPSVIVDGPFGSNLKTSDYVEHGVPVLQGMNVTNDKFNRRDIRFISPKKAKELFRSNAKPGDILSVKIGSVGYSALIDTLNEHEYAIIPANLLRTRVDNLIADNKFVYYLLTSISGKQRILDIASNTAQPALSLTKFKALRFKCPPLPTQRKITRILSTIDGQIEKTEAIIAKYQAVKQGMLQDLFTRGIDVRTGQLRPRYEDAPDLYQESALGMIPKEWTYTTIGDILTLQRGVDITSKNFVKGNVPVYSSSGLQGYHNKSIAKGPGVITGRKGTLGKVYYTDLPYWPHDTTLWVKDFKGNNAHFIYYLLQDMDLSKHDEATANPTLNRNNVHPLKIIFPLKDEEQSLIAKTISNHVDRINSEIKTLAKLHLLKQGMMQDLLSGKVEVK